jgi:hypothetical protein
MRTNDFLERGGQFDVAYTSPSVDVLALRAEGVLCGSGYDVPGAGYDDENDLGDI